MLEGVRNYRKTKINLKMNISLLDKKIYKKKMVVTLLHSKWHSFLDVHQV